MQAQEVLLQGRPPISYDLLSINVGITPFASSVPGAAEHATTVKPIDRQVTCRMCGLAMRWQVGVPAQLLARLSKEAPISMQAGSGDRRILPCLACCQAGLKADTLVTLVVASSGGVKNSVRA